MTKNASVSQSQSPRVDFLDGWGQGWFCQFDPRVRKTHLSTMLRWSNIVGGILWLCDEKEAPRQGARNNREGADELNRTLIQYIV